MSLNKSVILRLYRDLIKYGQQLKYTDKAYYKEYIRNQFVKYRDLKEEKDIERAFKVLFIKLSFE